jgi:hypothetical protein
MLFPAPLTRDHSVLRRPQVPREYMDELAGLAAGSLAAHDIQDGDKMAARCALGWAGLGWAVLCCVVL